MIAIILAGGFGTRLQTVVKDVPKPMAEINGFPFLKYLLESLSKQGVTTVILSVGYKQKIIKDYFQNQYLNMEIIYSSEDTPLGTGGAILQALTFTKDEIVFILNGDTFFDVDLRAMSNLHKETNADITLATKKMEKFNRYGTLDINEGRVIGFQEKKYQEKGLINGGIYLINSKLFQAFELPSKFSFESDFLEHSLQTLFVNAFISDGYFIDIGIPEDYYHARTIFNNE